MVLNWTNPSVEPLEGIYRFTIEYEAVAGLSETSLNALIDEQLSGRLDSRNEAELIRLAAAGRNSQILDWDNDNELVEDVRNPTAGDNCLHVANPSQADADEDGVGDACDPVNNALSFVPSADEVRIAWRNPLESADAGGSRVEDLGYADADLVAEISGSNNSLSFSFSSASDNLTVSWENPTSFYNPTSGRVEPIEDIADFTIEGGEMTVMVEGTEGNNAGGDAVEVELELGSVAADTEHNIEVRAAVSNGTHDVSILIGEGCVRLSGVEAEDEDLVACGTARQMRTIPGEETVSIASWALSVTGPSGFNETVVLSPDSTEDISFDYNGTSTYIYEANSEGDWTFSLSYSYEDMAGVEKTVDLSDTANFASHVNFPYSGMVVLGANLDGDHLADSVDEDDDNDGILDTADAAPQRSALVGEVEVAYRGDTNELGKYKGGAASSHNLTGLATDSYYTFTVRAHIRTYTTQANADDLGYSGPGTETPNAYDAEADESSQMTAQSNEGEPTYIGANNDNDELADVLDVDDDNDLLTDVLEPPGCVLNSDCDGDGLTDGAEYYELDDEGALVLDEDGEAETRISEFTYLDDQGMNVTNNCLVEADCDGDGTDDGEDVFILDATEGVDSDEDGIGDNVDNCDLVANPSQANRDGDSAGDECDADDNNLGNMSLDEDDRITVVRSSTYGDSEDRTVFLSEVRLRWTNPTEIYLPFALPQPLKNQALTSVSVEVTLADGTAVTTVNHPRLSITTGSFGADGLELAEGDDNLALASGAINEYRVSGLQNATSYSFTVRGNYEYEVAEYLSDRQPAGEVVLGVVDLSTSGQLTKPAAPPVANLMAQDGENEIGLSWRNPVPDDIQDGFAIIGFNVTACRYDTFADSQAADSHINNCADDSDTLTDLPDFDTTPNAEISISLDDSNGLDRAYLYDFTVIVNYNNTEGTGEMPNSVGLTTPTAVAIYPDTIPAVQSIAGMNLFGNFDLYVTRPFDNMTTEFDRIGKGISDYRIAIKDITDGSDEMTYSRDFTVEQMGELNEGNYTLSHVDLSGSSLPAEYSEGSLFEVNVSVVYGTGQVSAATAGDHNKLTVGPELVAPVVTAPFGNDEIEVSWTHDALPAQLSELYAIHYDVGLDLTASGCGSFVDQGINPLLDCDRGVSDLLEKSDSPTINFPVALASSPNQDGGDLVRGRLYTVDLAARYTAMTFSGDVYHSTRDTNQRSGIYPTPVGIENLQEATSGSDNVELTWDEFTAPSVDADFAAASGYAFERLAVLVDSEDDTTSNLVDEVLELPTHASGYIYTPPRPGQLYQFTVVVNYTVGAGQTPLKPAYRSDSSESVVGGRYPNVAMTPKVQEDIVASRDAGNDLINVMWGAPDLSATIGSNFTSQLGYGVKDYTVQYCTDDPGSLTTPDADCTSIGEITNTETQLNIDDGLPRAMLFTNIIVRANYEGKNNTLSATPLEDRESSAYTDFDAADESVLLYLNPAIAGAVSNPSLEKIRDGDMDKVRVSWTNPDFADFNAIEQQVNVTLELCKEGDSACFLLGEIPYEAPASLVPTSDNPFPEGFTPGDYRVNITLGYSTGQSSETVSSGVVTLALTNPPPRLISAPFGTNDIEVTWEAPPDDSLPLEVSITGYEVDFTCVSGQTGCSDFIQRGLSSTATETTSGVDHGFGRGLAYEVQVRALYSAGDPTLSEDTITSGIYPEPVAPTITQIGVGEDPTSNITLNWNIDPVPDVSDEFNVGLMIEKGEAYDRDFVLSIYIPGPVSKPDDREDCIEDDSRCIEVRFRLEDKDLTSYTFTFDNILEGLLPQDRDLLERGQVYDFEVNATYTARYPEDGTEGGGRVGWGFYPAAPVGVDPDSLAGNIQVNDDDEIVITWATITESRLDSKSSEAFRGLLDYRITGYTVGACNATGCNEVTNNTPGDDTFTATIGGLKPGVYNITVVANYEGEDNDGAAPTAKMSSEAISINDMFTLVEAGGEADNLPPSLIINEPFGDDEIVVAWEPPADPQPEGVFIRTYDVVFTCVDGQEESCSDYTRTGLPNTATEIRVTDSNIDRGQAYNVQVIARYNIGRGARSEEIKSGIYPEPVVPVTTGIGVGSDPTNEIELSWSFPTNGDSLYGVTSQFNNALTEASLGPYDRDLVLAVNILEPDTDGRHIRAEIMLEDGDLTSYRFTYDNILAELDPADRQLMRGEFYTFGVNATYTNYIPDDLATGGRDRGWGFYPAAPAAVASTGGSINVNAAGDGFDITWLAARQNGVTDRTFRQLLGYGITGYTVKACPVGSTIGCETVTVNRPSGATFNAEISGLDPGNYEITVVTNYEGLDNDSAATMPSTKMSSREVPIGTKRIGNPPPSLISAPFGTNDIEVTWEGPSESIPDGVSITGYDIVFTCVAGQGASCSDYTRTGLSNTATTTTVGTSNIDRRLAYEVQVRAVYSAGDPVPSENTITSGIYPVPKAPMTTGIGVGEDPTSNITLDWTIDSLPEVSGEFNTALMTETGEDYDRDFVLSIYVPRDDGNSCISGKADCIQVPFLLEDEREDLTSYTFTFNNILEELLLADRDRLKRGEVYGFEVNATYTARYPAAGTEGDERVNWGFYPAAPVGVVNTGGRVTPTEDGFVIRWPTITGRGLNSKSSGAFRDLLDYRITEYSVEACHTTTDMCYEETSTTLTGDFTVTFTGLELGEAYNITVMAEYVGKDNPSATASTKLPSEAISIGIYTTEVLVDGDGDFVGDEEDIDDDGDGLIEIRTAAELNQIRDQLGGTSYGSAADQTGCGGAGGITECSGYELMNDITLTGNWVPVGTNTAPFAATFEGNGNSITGLNINDSRLNYVGFFGALEGATVRNLHIEFGDILPTVTPGVGTPLVGVVAGRMTHGSRLLYVSVNGSLVGVGTGDEPGSSAYQPKVGGLVGIVGIKGDATATDNNQIIGSAAIVEGIYTYRFGGGLVGEVITREPVTSVITASYAHIGTLIGTTSQSNSGNSILGGLASRAEVDTTNSYAVVGTLSSNRAKSIGGPVFEEDNSAAPDSATIDSVYGNISIVNLPGNNVLRTKDNNRTVAQIKAFDGTDDDTTEWVTITGAGAGKILNLDGDSTTGDSTDPGDLLNYYCDTDNSGEIESDEQTDNNILWDFGTSTEFPAISCLPISVEDQRALFE